MKISRGQLIKVLRNRIIKSVLIKFLMLCLIFAAGFIVYKLVELTMRGKDTLGLLKENWFCCIGFVMVWYAMIYSCWHAQGGYIFDILLMRVNKLSNISRHSIEFVGVRADVLDYASEYNVLIRSDMKKKPLMLYANEGLELIPKGTKYHIYYLAGSKTIVNVEVLEGGTVAKKTEVAFMREPVMPHFSKEELKSMTKEYRWRPLGLFLYCVAGVVSLAIWGIYSTQNYFYWYIREIERCISIWVLLGLLEILFIALFRMKDRGYFWDLYRSDICVTEVIPISNIYGSGYLADARDRIKGVELEVKEGIHKNKKFLLYKDVSEYWNCFPMNVHKHWRFRGVFEPGSHQLEAVRLYYLKNSRIIVKMDV